MSNKGYHYFKIDVHDRNGYSFLVCTRYDENEDTIVDLVNDCQLFDDAEDYYKASAERVEKGDYDYRHLEDTLVYLDAE